MCVKSNVVPDEKRKHVRGKDAARSNSSRPRYVLSRTHAVLVFEAAEDRSVTVDVLASNDLDACLIDQSLYAPRVLFDEEKGGDWVFVELDASQRYALRAAALDGVYDAPASLTSALAALEMALREKSFSDTPAAECALSPYRLPEVDVVLDMLSAVSSPVLDDMAPSAVR